MCVCELYMDGLMFVTQCDRMKLVSSGNQEVCELSVLRGFLAVFLATGSGLGWSSVIGC